jgi:hypothetical protein
VYRIIGVSSGVSSTAAVDHVATIAVLSISNSTAIVHFAVGSATLSGFECSALSHVPLLEYKSCASLVRKRVGTQGGARLPFRTLCELVQNIARRRAPNLCNSGTARRAVGLVVAVAPRRNTAFTEQVVATIDARIRFVLEAHEAASRLCGGGRTVSACAWDMWYLHGGIDAQAFLYASPLQLEPLQPLLPRGARPAVS